MFWVSVKRHDLIEYSSGDEKYFTHLYPPPKTWQKIVTLDVQAITSWGPTLPWYLTSVSAAVFSRFLSQLFAQQKCQKGDWEPPTLRAMHQGRIATIRRGSTFEANPGHFRSKSVGHLPKGAGMFTSHVSLSLFPRKVWFKWFRNPKQPPVGCMKPGKHGINYQPQLISRIFHHQ